MPRAVNTSPTQKTSSTESELSESQLEGIKAWDQALLDQDPDLQFCCSIPGA
jgi:hypothetical protein